MHRNIRYFLSKIKQVHLHIASLTSCSMIFSQFFGPMTTKFVFIHMFTGTCLQVQNHSTQFFHLYIRDKEATVALICSVHPPAKNKFKICFEKK